MQIRIFAVLGLTGFVFSGHIPAFAQSIVPGTGHRLEDVGDDFEDPEWKYFFNGAKSSFDNNKDHNYPLGESANERWYEGQKRGHMDIIRRVPTPEGGLKGSTGALLLQSRDTGIPGRPSRRTEQDDLICDVYSRLDGRISVHQNPNCVVRVFLPPIDQWEQRSGSHFAFRIALERNARKADDRVYWPGMMIVLESKEETGAEHDYAYVRIRGDRYGSDFKGKQITTTGWWTLGMSVTGDGMVHYYAKPGVANLTAADRITSQYPYGSQALRFRNFFFNVLSVDDGRTWSTPWIIDDPAMYVAPPARTARY